MFIELGGKNRKIRFDYNALADLEQGLGQPIQKYFADVSNIGFNFLRILVWAGLKSSDPGLTIQRAGMFINQALEEGMDLDTLTKTFLEALHENQAFKGTSAEKNVPTE